MPYEELYEWTPFWKPRVPDITRRIGKGLRRKGFSIAREFCWRGQHDNAFAGKEGTVEEVVCWLIEEFGVEMDQRQYPGFVNLHHNDQPIQVQAIGIGKYADHIIVILPFIRTETEEEGTDYA